MFENRRASEGRARRRPAFPRSLSLLLILAVAAVACTKKEGQPPQPSEAGPAAPVAAGPPIGAEESIRPPSAKPEPLSGKAVLLVDSSSKSVYQFDTGRGRFQGPAPEIALPDRRVTLPGYPVPVSEEAPQDVAVVGNWVVVAGGLDGTAVFLDRSKGDLSVAGRMPLPVREVVLEDSGKRSTNADAELKRPFIVLMSSFGRDRILAVSRENALSTSVGYVLDPASKRVVAAAQLPGGLSANVVQGYRDTAVAGMATKKLVFLSHDLKATREIALPGNPTHLVIVGDTAYVSLREPTALVSVNLVSGAVTSLGSKPEETIGGPLAVENGTVWWAHTNLGTITRVDVSTGETETVQACESISSMVRYEKALYVACPGKKTFGLIPDGKPIVPYRVDGFPISVAGPL